MAARPVPAAAGDGPGGAGGPVRGLPLWLDSPLRPRRRDRLEGELTVDLAVVGAGFTGLWSALLAVEQEPARSVAVLDGGDLAWAASGRNGGFCSATLTHGLANGLSRWPAELPLLLRLGHQNLDAIEATVRRYDISCDFTRSGELDVALAPWQWDDLVELHAQGSRLGERLFLLDAGEVRAVVNSPTYLGALHDPRGTAVVDPARLVWGLADTVQRLGVRVHERSRVVGLRDEGDRVRLQLAAGSVLARQVVLATNAFPSPLRRVRPFVVPVWDHVLATEPLSAGQRAAIGWTGREGIADGGNRFHYYRLTHDGRIVWGGYDAHYWFGGDRSPRRQRHPGTEAVLERHFRATFPQLETVRFSHAWGGMVDTCTRFTAFWARGLGGKVVAVQGYTGLGVGASRFGAQVALDLVAGADTERTRLAMVRTRPAPFPPEPARWAGITLTRRSLARADTDAGRRDLWLRTLDRCGLGFDS
jgi:glycine/D-amino acid oxidase-like deaminating enzyme